MYETSSVLLNYVDCDPRAAINCGYNCYTGRVLQSAEAGGHVEQEELPEPEPACDDSAATAAGLGAGTDFGKGDFINVKLVLGF